MLEYRISWKVLKIFTQEFLHGDLDFFNSKVKLAFLAFIFEEFMDFVEDFDAKVNKYS